MSSGICAVRSGPSLIAYRIIGYGRTYRCIATVLIRLCGFLCPDWICIVPICSKDTDFLGAGHIKIICCLAHLRLNKLSHTIYWKSQFSILDMLGYMMYILLKKKWLNCLQTVETLIRRRVLRRLIWVYTVCKLSV